MGLELLKRADISGVSDNYETVLTTGGHFLQAQGEMHATGTDRVRNVLIVGLVGWLPPIDVVVGVNGPSVKLLEVLVLASHENSGSQGRGHDLVCAGVHLSESSVGLIVRDGRETVILSLGGQLAHLEDMVGEDTAKPEAVVLHEERDGVDDTSHLQEAENGVVLGGLLGGHEDFVGAGRREEHDLTV